jgi:hypothetical protein
MLSTSQTTWLLLGALAGYSIMMWSNPVRGCLGDGWRAVRRYPALWRVLGWFGFANALFALGTRAWVAMMLPSAERPAFIWVREAWRDPRLWLAGSPDSLWWLSREEFLAVLRSCSLPALEKVAGLFDHLTSTFPLSAFFALFIVFAWSRPARTFREALWRRYKKWSVVIYFGVFTAAAAALVKPALFFAPALLPYEWWEQWGQVVAGVAFGFEYLLGIGAQVFLLLLAYAWIRGLNFEHRALIDVAIRRLVSVLQWAAFVLLLGFLLIEMPLILKNFPALAPHFAEDTVFARQINPARAALCVLLVLGGTVQITLALHASSWRKAWREHWQIAARAWWPLGWFVVTAAVHFFLWQALYENLARGFGEGTALWVAWKLVSPWIAALIGGWLLASWVCVYHRHGRGSPAAETPASLIPA